MVNGPVSALASPPGALVATTSQPLRVTDIRPDGRRLDFGASDLWRYRGLLLVLIGRDLKVLYRQTALGAAWAIAQPLFTVAIFTVIFGHFAKMPADGLPYALFAGTAVVLWTYYAEALRRSASSLVGEAELIRKIYFPRLVIPLAAVISPLVDLAIALVVLLLLMAWDGFTPGPRLLLMPAVVLATGTLALGVGLWLGPTNVRFRDVKHTLPFLVQLWMYASPVAYAVSIVPGEWRWVFALNPMVGLIEAFRWTLLPVEPPDAFALGVSIAAAVLLVGSGLLFFRRMERSFADVI